MNFLELKVPPPVQFLICGLLLWFLASMFPGTTVQVPHRLFIAVVLGGMGLAIELTCLLAFSRHRTTINPLRPERSRRLVVSGMYRWSRNPMYLGMLMGLSGLGVFFANVLACLVVLPLFVGYMTRFQILPEERVMANKFGADYAAYMKQVRRWL